MTISHINVNLTSTWRTSLKVVAFNYLKIAFYMFLF